MTAPLEPPLPPDVDVRDLDGFMLNVERLTSSELWALSTGEEFKAAVALWCKAWKQIPAASLPDNDRVLASWAGVPLDRWPEVRDLAMRGFTLCADGRYYHSVLAQDAVRAYEKKKAYRERSSKANAKRWHGERPIDPEGPAGGDPANAGSGPKVPETPKPILDGRESLLDGADPIQQGLLEPPQGQGQGQGQEEEILTDLRPKPDKPVRTRSAYPADFEQFWGPYPTDRLMSKSDTAKAWAKLTKEDRASAIAAIPGFVSYCRKHPDYRPVHAVRFLTQRRFDGFDPAADGRSRDSPAGSSEAAIDVGGGKLVAESLIRSVVGRGGWLPEWGPRWDQPGCKVPERLRPAATKAA